jgi:hypothetical protein
MMERTLRNRYLSGALFLAVFSGLYLTGRYSYVLFHSLAELFSVELPAKE